MRGGRCAAAREVPGSRISRGMSQESESMAERSISRVRERRVWNSETGVEEDAVKVGYAVITPRGSAALVVMRFEGCQLPTHISIHGSSFGGVFVT